jgi:hypothetical protein
MKLAHHIDIQRGPDDQFHLTIDGEEFPWYITTEGVSTTVTDDRGPAVTLTIMCDRVTTTHDIRPSKG